MTDRPTLLPISVYPEPKPSLLMRLAKRYLVSVQLQQKTLEMNAQSMDELRKILFHDVPTIRISDTFATPEMAPIYWRSTLSNCITK